MHSLTIVKITLIHAAQKNLSSGDVGGNGDTVHITQTEQILLVGVSDVRFERITEEKNQIDLVTGDTSRDLLDASQPSGEVTVDRKTGTCDNIRPVVPVAMTVLRERIAL